MAQPGCPALRNMWLVTLLTDPGDVLQTPLLVIHSLSLSNSIIESVILCEFLQNILTPKPVELGT